MLRQRLAHGLLDLGGELRLLPQRRAQRSDTEGRPHRLVEVARADRQVVGMKLDLAESCLGQDALDLVGCGEGEGARRVGIRPSRRGGEEPRRGGQGRRHEGIELHRPPADESEPPSLGEAGADDPKGGRGVGEEHHPES